MVKFNRSDFTRIYSALIVPFNEDESVNFDALRDLVEMELQSGVEGFYVCGSSGEGLLLSVDERCAVTECVVSQTAGRVPVIAHCGTIRTQDAITLAKAARSCGCRAVSLIPPYYYHFSMDEICGYYEDVMEAVPDLPMILYNIPQFTGIEFSKQNAERLLSNPNIVGVKHTSHNLYSLERMSTSYPEKVLINGFDEQFLGALAMGAEATIGTTVNIFAPLFKEIREEYRRGNMQQALTIQKDLNQRVEDLVSVGIFPAAKYACTVLGVNCGTCRKPFSALTEEQKELVKRTVLRPYPMKSEE